MKHQILLKIYKQSMLQMGLIIPIENIFAPKVVIPPCASNNAWKIKTIEANTAVTAGPNNTAPNPFTGRM